MRGPVLDRSDPRLLNSLCLFHGKCVRSSESGVLDLKYCYSSWWGQAVGHSMVAVRLKVQGSTAAVCHHMDLEDRALSQRRWFSRLKIYWNKFQTCWDPWPLSSFKFLPFGMRISILCPSRHRVLEAETSPDFIGPQLERNFAPGWITPEVFFPPASWALRLIRHGPPTQWKAICLTQSPWI